MTPTLKAQILANMAMSKAKTTQANVTQVIIPPAKANSLELAKPAVPVQYTLHNDPPGDQDPPLSPQPLETGIQHGLSRMSLLPDDLALLPNDLDFSMDDCLGSQFPENNLSDGLSYTSTLPDVFDVGMGDLAQPATRSWMVIDHFTGEIIVDEDVPPAIPVPGAPPNSAIQVEVVPALGIPALIQTPLPTLLFSDQDVRPDWLLRSTRDHLQYTPYYMCLGRVVDLFLAQEVRLGYLIKVG